MALSYKEMLAEGLHKKTYDIGLRTSVSVSVRFALEEYLRKKLSDDYK